jgi:hypothetical protein
MISTALIESDPRLALSCQQLTEKMNLLYTIFKFIATHIIDKVCCVIIFITFQMGENTIFVGARCHNIFIAQSMKMKMHSTIAYIKLLPVKDIVIENHANQFRDKVLVNRQNVELFTLPILASAI